MAADIPGWLDGSQRSWIDGIFQWTPRNDRAILWIAFRVGGTMANRRNSGQTLRCTWCNRVRAGGSWADERRKSAGNTYSNVICKKCKGYYLAGFDADEFMAWARREIRTEIDDII